MGTKAAVVVTDELGVHAELRALGLTMSVMDIVREAWYRAAASATAFEPSTAPGTKGWIAGVGAMRETLAIAPFRDWAAADRRNLPLVINRKVGVSITATSGDQYTGWVDPQGRQPRTKNPKGLVLAEAIERNGQQLELLGDDYMRRPDGKPYKVDAASLTITYLLLVFNTDTAMRAELSLPERIVDGEIDKWAKRIILPEMFRDRLPPARKAEDDGGGSEDTIDVPVKRR
jgi:hypothetical protein